MNRFVDWDIERVVGVVEEYNPVTDTWTKKTDMATPRREAAACVVDGEIYVIGGSASVDGLNVATMHVATMDVYTP